MQPYLFLKRKGMVDCNTLFVCLFLIAPPPQNTHRTGNSNSERPLRKIEDFFQVERSLFTIAPYI